MFRQQTGVDTFVISPVDNLAMVSPRTALLIYVLLLLIADFLDNQFSRQVFASSTTW